MKITDILITELTKFAEVKSNKHIKYFIKKFNKMDSNKQYVFIESILEQTNDIIKSTLPKYPNMENRIRATIMLLLMHDSIKVTNMVLTELINSNEDIKLIRNFTDKHYICDYVDKDNKIINEDSVFLLEKYKYIKNKLNKPSYIIPIKCTNKHRIEDYDLSQVKAQCKVVSSGLCYKVYNNKLYVASYMLHNSIGLEVDEFKFLGKDYIFHQIDKVTQIQNKTVKGKDWIKHYLFNDTKLKGYLYFIQLEINDKITYKVGITKDINTRYNKKEMETFKSYEYFEMYMLEAAIIERYLHLNNHHIKDNSFIKIESKFNNTTELYHYNLLNIYLNNKNILQEAVNHLNIEGYPIPSEAINIVLHNLRKS